MHWFLCMRAYEKPRQGEKIHYVVLEGKSRLVANCTCTPHKLLDKAALESKDSTKPRERDEKVLGFRGTWFQQGRCDPLLLDTGLFLCWFCLTLSLSLTSSPLLLISVQWVIRRAEASQSRQRQGAFCATFMGCLSGGVCPLSPAPQTKRLSFFFSFFLSSLSAFFPAMMFWLWHFFW